MLKISQTEKSNHSLTLKLEGSVVGPWVEELRQVCETLMTEGCSLKLDLADVAFADAGGVAALAGLRTRGVSLANGSAFLAEQLKSPKPD